MVKKFTHSRKYSEYATLEDINDYVNKSSKINPGAVRMSRRLYDGLIRMISKPQWLPVSEKPYVLHVPTAHGFLPVFPSDNLKDDEIWIEPAVNVHEEFEKIVMRDE